MCNLRVKYDHGLFGDAYHPDPTEAENVVRSEELGRIEVRAAETAVHVVRDEQGWWRHRALDAGIEELRGRGIEVIREIPG